MHPGGRKEISLDPARATESISTIMHDEQFPLNTRCGGRGICEGCVVELVDGVVERIGRADQKLADGSPLRIRGCQYRVVSERATIHIPRRSSSFYQPQVVSDFRHCVTASRDPLVQVEPSDTRAFAAAVDVGTTTVVVMLTELGSGKVLSRAADFNAQIAFGEDVITRIELCTSDKNNITVLRDALLTKTIRPLLLEAMKRSKIQPHELRCISFAGNTTMLHLLAGVDPTSMGISPFTPVFLDHRTLPAAQLLGDEFARAEAHLLPSASAYVGADLTAGAVASGFIYDPGPSLLIDVGTNGEILLKTDNTIYACATAAGPAFEGAGLLSGMRAGDGAISHITIDPGSLQTDFDIIGPPAIAPAGICGSGYVDFLAEARSAELLGSTGRFNGDNATHPNFACRLTREKDDLAFSITPPDAASPVRISQRDVSRLLQAKAAIAAGIHTLLMQQNLKPTDIRMIYLAGGFGTHLCIDAAIACGLLPGFRADQVRVCGNLSLAGAYLALLDRSLLEEMKRAADGMQIVELNKDPAFESLYIDHLSLGD
jgi:uncharacterized 2Fe-2S/4Fe-4S cluster protein (DUF4445 family)